MPMKRQQSDVFPSNVGHTDETHKSEAKARRSRISIPVNTIVKITGTCAGAHRQPPEEAKKQDKWATNRRPHGVKSLQFVLPLIRVNQSESETHTPAPGLIDEPSRQGQASNLLGANRTNDEKIRGQGWQKRAVKLQATDLKVPAVFE